MCKKKKAKNMRVASQACVSDPILLTRDLR